MSRQCSPATADTSWANNAPAARPARLDFSTSNTWLDLLADRSPRASLCRRKSMKRTANRRYHAGHPEVVKARELHRMGMAAAEIARELQVELAHVERWERRGYFERRAQTAETGRRGNWTK